MQNCFGRYSINAVDHCKIQCFTIDECRIHESVLADRDRLKSELDELKHKGYDESMDQFAASPREEDRE